MTVGSRLLEVADALLNYNNANELYFRRSISTVYYAVLQDVLDFSVEHIDKTFLMPIALKYQMRRSVTHEHLNSLCNKLDTKSEEYLQYNLSETVRKLGRNLADLYNQRLAADYDYSISITLAATEVNFVTARGCIELINEMRLEPKDALLFAVKVLMPIKTKEINLKGWPVSWQ